MLAGLIVVAFFYIVWYFGISRIIEKDRTKLIKRYSDRDLLTALKIELNAMRFRLANKNEMTSIELQASMYNEAYKKFPSEFERINKEAKVNRDQITKLIEETALKEGINIEVVNTYLRPFPFLNEYFNH